MGVVVAATVLGGIATCKTPLRHTSYGQRRDAVCDTRLYMNRICGNCGHGMECVRLESLPTSTRIQASSGGHDAGMEENPWDVLGVSPSASEKEIKKAHRRLVLEHHPDRYHHHEEEEKEAKRPLVERRFMKIQEAYEMLMGRRHGHVMGSKEGQNGWNFHDFFWSFNYHRRKKHMQGGGGRHRPPPPAGSWKEQMSQLKQRAAIRRRREEEQRRKEKVEGRDNLKEEGLFSQISQAYSVGKRQHDEALHRMAGRSSSQIQSFQRIFSHDGEAPLREEEEHHHQQQHQHVHGVSGGGVSHQLAGLKRRAELKKRILK